jgi:hypothetical protein
MISLTGSRTTFSGEPNEEGLVLCFMVLGEPDELRGESGGVFPAGNKEGNGLIERALVFVEFSSALKGTPAFASASNDLTCVKNASMKKGILKEIYIKYIYTY